LLDSRRDRADFADLLRGRDVFHPRGRANFIDRR
jgi:hypothetical protein